MAQPKQNPAQHDDAIRRAAQISAISQNLTLYAHLVDMHEWDQMERVFVPETYLSMPEPHFEDLQSLKAFQYALKTYATWNMQHCIMTPLVDFDKDYTKAHAETHFIGTIFDNHDPLEARPEEVEYGSYLTDHVWTEDGWRIKKMTLRIFGRSFPTRDSQRGEDQNDGSQNGS